MNMEEIYFSEESEEQRDEIPIKLEIEQKEKKNKVKRK